MDHPNAVAIFDVGELDGEPYIVMELVEGRTLRRVPGDTLPPLSTRLAQLDFGIARRTRGTVAPEGATQPALPTLTLDGVKLGTPVYMAPEQIRGEELDGRADQFAWGVLAYELLAEKLPWGGGGDALAALGQQFSSRALRLRGGDQVPARQDAAQRDAWFRQRRLMFYRHDCIEHNAGTQRWLESERRELEQRP